MEKIKTIKVRNEDGSISEESYEFSINATNIDLDNGKNLQDTIGNINVTEDGDIENQLKNKVNKTDIEDSLTSSNVNKVLSAKQGKILNDTLEKKVYFFNNIAEIKSATNLKNGDYVISKGYYDINDDGGRRIFN